MSKSISIEGATQVAPLTLEQVSTIRRQEIRYALFRCRTGNPEPEHLAIFNFYEPRLTKYGLNPTGFSTMWDVSKERVTDLVSGHVLGIYQEDLEIFNPDGSLKD